MFLCIQSGFLHLKINVVEMYYCKHDQVQKKINNTIGINEYLIYLHGNMQVYSNSRYCNWQFDAITKTYDVKIFGTGSFCHDNQTKLKILLLKLFMNVKLRMVCDICKFPKYE